MIDVLDALDAQQEDLEDDDPREDGGDDEPSLGATEAFSHFIAWRVDGTLCGDYEISLGVPDSLVNQEFRSGAFGSFDDAEDEHCGREPEEDFEVSLGAAEPLEPGLGEKYLWNGKFHDYSAEYRDSVYDQRNWGSGCYNELEHDDADLEGQVDDLPIDDDEIENNYPDVVL